MSASQIRALQRQREAANTERLLLVGRIHRLNEEIARLQAEDLELDRGVSLSPPRAGSSSAGVSPR